MPHVLCSISPEERIAAMRLREPLFFVTGCVLGLAVGVCVGLLCAPRTGRSSRRHLRDQANHYLHATKNALTDQAPRLARYYSHRLSGMGVELVKKMGLRQETMLTDQDLANKVRTHLGRLSRVDLGSILVDCAGGVCTLRGSAPSANLIQEIEQEVDSVAGVCQVRNMLHVLRPVVSPAS